LLFTIRTFLRGSSLLLGSFLLWFLVFVIVGVVVFHIIIIFVVAALLLNDPEVKLESQRDDIVLNRIAQLEIVLELLVLLVWLLVAIISGRLG
jgi:hypothetical protein